MNDRSLLVVVPALARPQNVVPLLASLDGSLHVEIADGWSVRCQFVCTRGDDAEIAAVEAAGLEPLVVPDGYAQYARKTNAAVRASTEEWILCGADDLAFHAGWFTAALRAHEETGKLVIGTNDLGNQTVVRGDHATHPLVHRDYVRQGTIDNRSKLLHDGYDHNACNPPEAPVWMADLSFKSLGDVRVGDEVMGWHRPARDHLSRDQIDDLLASSLSNRKVGDLVGVSYNHISAVRSGRVRWEDRYRPWKMPLKRLCAGTVLAIQARTAPIMRVAMASGREFRCTPDHLWLNGMWSPSIQRSTQWVTARPGRTLLHVIDQPRRLSRDEEWLAGWIGGIYDGEGSGVYVATQSVTANPEVSAAISVALDKIGLPHSTPDGTYPGVKHYSLLGGRQTFLNFLTWCRPIKDWRLRARLINSARFGIRDKVVSVTPLGEERVISMTTTTGNYIAWGYASKNCDVEFWQTALARGQAVAASESIVEHLHPLWHREVKRDKTYQKGMRNAVLDRELLRRRERLWRGLQPRTGPLKLNLGCGPHVMRGFDNLDLPDWRFQTGLGFYADGSVAGISISHALMHLPEKDWPAFFAEVARVLEPRGVVRVTEDSTRDPASSRFGGFQRPATLTHPALVIRHMTDAGLDAREVGRDETAFRDGSLIQARHGAAPKCFWAEGIKP